MSATELEYTIDNIGGVEHLDVKLSPGVNVLKAPNGFGKTSAIKAISRAQGGRVAIEKRDGAERGSVTGPGVSLNVRSVASVTGEAVVELADVGPLARLIDPGIKDTDKAALARIRALVELLDLGVEDAHVERMCGGDEDLARWLRDTVRDEAVDDLLAVSEKLRARANGLAHQQERIAEEAASQARFASESCEKSAEIIGAANIPKVIDGPKAVEAAVHLDSAVRDHERALNRCEARESLERLQSDIRSTLGPRPDINAAIKKREVAADKAVNTLASIRELEKEIGVLRERLRGFEHERDEAVRAVDSTAAYLRRWEQQKATLDEPLDGPTREDVERMERDVVQPARDALKVAELADAYRKDDAARQEAERASKVASDAAKKLRGLVKGIPEKLGEILKSAGAPGLTVVDGRLHATRDAEPPQDFELRCSTGQRVALALDVAAHSYKGKVLPLAGETWAALDPEHKKLFAELAAERGLFVITEQPAEGELRIERAGA